MEHSTPLGRGVCGESHPIFLNMFHGVTASSRVLEGVTPALLLSKTSSTEEVTVYCSCHVYGGTIKVLNASIPHQKELSINQDVCMMPLCSQLSLTIIDPFLNLLAYVIKCKLT